MSEGRSPITIAGSSWCNFQEQKAHEHLATSGVSSARKLHCFQIIICYKVSIMSPFLFPLQCSPSDAVNMLNKTLYLLHIHIYMPLKARCPLVMMNMIFSWSICWKCFQGYWRTNKKNPPFLWLKGFCLFVLLVFVSYPCWAIERVCGHRGSVHNNNR